MASQQRENLLGDHAREHLSGEAKVTYRGSQRGNHGRHIKAEYEAMEEKEPECKARSR